MKAIIVARVSTEEQKEAGNSLPAQITRLENYCHQKDYKVIQTYSFSESAYKNKRDEFDKLLKYVQEMSGKEKIAVCFDKVDRLSRSVFDKRVGTLYEMAVADIIELHFVSDGQIINNQMSAVAKFQFGMSLGLAKYYSDAIGDNVKRTFEKKRRNGEWTGRVRLGYLNVSANIEKRLRKDIIIDPERGHLVKKIFELYATDNYSYNSILEEITALGLRSLDGNELSKSNIENIIKDSFYCGTAVSKKYGSYPHKYPHLIARELFDKCQEVRESKRKNRQNLITLREYIFRGMLKCHDCGCAYSPEHHKGNNYYSCTNSKKICKRVYVNEKKLLEPIYEVLDRFESITEEAQDTLVKRIRESTEAEVVFHKAQINRIRTEYDKIKRKDDKLLEMYLDPDQSITKDIYDKKHQEYADKLQLLEIELSEHRNADYDYQTTVATVISIARRAKTIFNNCSEPAQKRVFLNYLLQNPTVSGRKIEFTLHSPFNLVLELAGSPSWLRR